MNPVKSPQLKTLKREVQLLRSFVIGVIGRDMEGEYRPEFIEHILNASAEEPTHAFRGASSFLKELKEHNA